MSILLSLNLKLLLVSAFLLNSLVRDVVARPAPDPKSEWVRKGPGRKKMANNLRRAIEGRQTRRQTTNDTRCSDTSATTITAPKTNIWGELNDTETASIVAWLFTQPELNLTASENATTWDNTIILIESMRPNKTDALAYMDGAAAPPTKWAHVVLDHLADVNPYYQDILVGPLPVDNVTTTWSPLTFPYTKKSDGRIRALDADGDGSQYTNWLYPISASIQDITLDLWNGTATGADNDTLDIWGIDPLWQEPDGSIIRWDTWWNYPVDDFDAETLLPLGLYVASNVTGRDPLQWELLGWLYNGIFYKTTKEFRDAYWSPGFEKLGTNVEGDWARSDRQGPILPMDTYYPPTSIAPAGSRFFVDPDAKYIEWMNWSFYISFSRDTGIALFDIRYNGTRLMYELGLQEALAHYAGNDPVQSGTSYLDSYYGFGPYAFEVVPGYDCPSYATLLNTTFYVSETSHTHINSLCLFEFDADYPIQRHSNDEYVSITRNTYFTVRSVSTVGNYDYMFSYTFFLDGSIAVEVRASGYIQSAYFAKNDDYGFHIHDYLSGSMHDHVLNFKADLDILGTENSVQLMTNVPVTKVYPWSFGKARNTMKLQRRFLETEDDGRFNWDFNSQTQVIFVNEHTTTDFGEYRGYRVLPYTGTVHLTVHDSSNLQNAAHWAEYDLQVTRQHDTEPRSAHPYNSQDTADPPLNFAEFFDGECLRQEDLVLWFNLGMHHIPHTGDLPNTVFTTAHSGIQFMPSNYFNIDTSRQTVNMVRIQFANGTATAVETFGQKDQECELQFTPVESDLWSYTGDVVVRKFPYDPNAWYYETDSIV